MFRIQQFAARRPFLLCCFAQGLLLSCGAFVDAAEAPANGGGVENGSRELELRKQVDAVLAQQKVVEQRTEELRQRKSQIEQELRSFREDGFDEVPPYPLSLLDRLRDELHAMGVEIRDTPSGTEWKVLR